MKIKSLLLSLVAVCTALVSCNEEFEPTYLDGLKVSSSYVSLPVAGGQTTITVTAGEAWTIDANEVPEWLTITPANGGAGETKVTFSAAAYEGRTASLHLTCGQETQAIEVIQGIAEVANATCAEILAGPDSKTYRVTGVCTKIANTSYGNWYINDGTGEVYIYGTVDAGGAYNWSKFNIEVGDEVTVEGPKTTYNGTVELVDATFISVNKSLIKVASVDPEDGALPTEGGDFTVSLDNKGKGLSVEVPEDAKSWLSLKAVNGNTVVFHASENNAGPRATTLTFKTSDGKKDYSCETSLSQAGSAGTLALPMTVEEAIAAANAGVTSEVYIKGIVSKVLSGGYGAQYGNASFWISADGTFNDDLALDFEVYQANWLGAEKWVEGNAQIAEGAEVIVYGPLTVYKGTAETQGKGAAHVYSVNGVTSDANGIGTLAAPFNALGGIEAAQAGIKSNVYVEGIVCELVKGGFDPAYGNGSFWISVDGTYAGDKAREFEAYQVNYLGGQKWNADTDPQIAIGDNVVIYGPLTTYNGTSETQGKGAAYVYSLNGKTE